MTNEDKPVPTAPLPSELNVELVVNSNKKKDCLACRLTGSAGLFLISVYVFSNVRKQTSRTNKQIINLAGAGRLFRRHRFFFHIN